MSEYACIYLSVCPYTYDPCVLCISAHARVLMYPRVLMLVYLHACMHVPTGPRERVSIYLRVHMSNYASVPMPGYLCIHASSYYCSMSMCPHAHMSEYLCICVSTCPTMHQCPCQGIYVFKFPHASISTVCAHMPTWQSIYISACPHVQLCILCISAHARVFMYPRVIMLVYLCAHTPTCQSIYVSACSHVQLCILCISAHARVFTYSSVLILVYLCAHMSEYLCICVSTCPSMHRWTC